MWGGMLGRAQAAQILQTGDRQRFAPLKHPFRYGLYIILKRIKRLQPVRARLTLGDRLAATQMAQHRVP